MVMVVLMDKASDYKIIKSKEAYQVPTLEVIKLNQGDIITESKGEEKWTGYYNITL